MRPSAHPGRLIATMLAAASFTAALAGPGTAAPAQPSLRIVSDQPMPPALLPALDVRWASDSSVYLSLLREGAVEASLDLAHPRVVKLIPGMREPGGSFAYFLAASSDYLVTTGPLWVTWRTIAKPLRAEDAFDSIHDVDVSKDRLLVVAARRDQQGRYAPEGAIAWIGSLRSGLADLKPVAFDATGPGVRNLNACSTFHMGGIRFMQDGSFLVVPGVQPGIHLYSPEGKLLRTWDSAAAGLDSDCGSLSQTQIRRYAVDWLARSAWLNQRRILDDILPLQQGPGLVIRSVSQGQVHWDLKILTKDGGVATYGIPLKAQNELSILKGDVRGNRIVFVMSAFKKDAMNSEVSRLVIAEAPR